MALLLAWRRIEAVGVIMMMIIKYGMSIVELQNFLLMSHKMSELVVDYYCNHHKIVTSKTTQQIRSNNGKRQIQRSASLTFNPYFRL